MRDNVRTEPYMYEVVVFDCEGGWRVVPHGEGRGLVVHAAAGRHDLRDYQGTRHGPGVRDDFVEFMCRILSVPGYEKNARQHVVK